MQAINSRLIQYWIQSHAFKLKDLSIDEIVDMLEQHDKRQEALQTLIIYERTKEKTKASTTFLLIDKIMHGLPSEERERVKKRMKARAKVSTKGRAPKKRKPVGKERQLRARLEKLGYTTEQIEQAMKNMKPS